MTNDKELADYGKRNKVTRIIAQHGKTCKMETANNIMLRIESVKMYSNFIIFTSHSNVMSFECDPNLSNPPPIMVFLREEISVTK